MLIRILISVAAIMINGVASAQEIATCRNPVGTAFRHFNGLQDKGTAGWSEEKISNGVFTLMRKPDGTLDMLYVDTRQKPISMSQDGGTIRVLRIGSDQISLLVYYEDASTEIYSFFTEKDGRSRFTLMTSRVGPKALFPKSGVMVGDCTPIRFDIIK